MTDFTAALVARLFADAGIAQQVADRIHWVTAPAGTLLPYILLTVVSDLDAGDLKGCPAGHDARVQIDSFAPTYGGARGLAGLVKTALRAPAEVDGVKFGRALFDGPRDLGEDGPTDWIYRASMDCALWHQPL